MGEKDVSLDLELIAPGGAEQKRGEIGGQEQVRCQAGRFKKASGRVVDFHARNSIAWLRTLLAPAS
jgi:hypothetical protein